MQITLFKGGTREVTLPVAEVPIPDVFKILEAMDITDGPERQALLECWHIAGALKRDLLAAATLNAELAKSCQPAIELYELIIGDWPDIDPDGQLPPELKAIRSAVAKATEQAG